VAADLGRSSPRAAGYLFARTSAVRKNQAVEHHSRERLVAGLGQIRDSPRDSGRLVLMARRPAAGGRDLPVEAMLDQAAGLAGDNWLARGSKNTPDGSADPQRQVTVMNARVAELVAGGTDRMALAGDQLYIDLDLSVRNLPAGSLLAVGQAVLQVSDAPHLGCAKFVERFGAEAMRFVNSPVGRQLRLRGVNTRVVVPGTVRLGDLAVKAHLPVSPQAGQGKLPADPGSPSGDHRHALQLP
jgi:MOSC domain-containing protein YiiM